MKAIQITVDERLLEELDGTEEARRNGRSAVFRRALVQYLSRERQRAVAESYGRAYGSQPGLGEEFEGWGEQGQWPKK